jgi:hypothetical protein
MVYTLDKIRYALRFSCAAENRITESNITSKSHIIWSVEQSLKNLNWLFRCIFATQTKSINAIWWNCRSGRKAKIRRKKIVDFGLSNFTNSQTEDSPKKEVSYNQVNFRLRILNLWLTEVLIICNWIKFAQCLGSVRICFQKGYSANPSFTTNISNISF